MKTSFATVVSFLISLCLLTSSPLGVAALYDEADDVQTFENKSDFKKRVVEGDGVWVIQFYAPWCGHCKALAPKYKQLATIFKGIVGVGAVDASSEGQPGQRIAQPYGVQGFPTIKIFAQGRTTATTPIDYDGARELPAMLQNIMNEVGKTLEARAQQLGLGGEKPSDTPKSTGPSKVVQLTTANFQEKVLDNPLVSMVAFIAPWCGHCKALQPEWDIASTKVDGEGAFLGIVDATVEEQLAGMYGIKGFPTIKVFPGGINKTHSDARDYQGERTSASIVREALAEVDRTGVPKEIPELTSQSLLEEECSGANKICVLAAVPHILDSGAEGRNKYRDLLSKVAKTFRGSAFTFLWYEGSAQPELEEKLELTFGFPAMVALSLDRHAYAVLRGSFTEKAIGTFLTGITTGRQGTVKLDGDMPKVVTVEPWNGEDGEAFEEEFSLDDIMGDL